MPLLNTMPNSVEAAIKALEARVAALEKALQVSAHHVVLQAGSGKITLKPGGDVHINGNSIELSSMGNTQIKAAGNITLKGAKVTQD